MPRKLLVAALLAAALVGGYLLRNQLTGHAPDAAAQAGPSAEPGARIVDFTLPDLDGTPHAFSEWAGKARLVNFWATWCAPCRREIPLLKETQAEQAENGVQVIGIAVDFLDDVTAYASEADFNYPILIGEDDAMAVAESSGVSFVGLPFTLVVAPDGRLLAAHMGEIVAPQMATIIEQLAQLQRGETDAAAVRTVLKQL